MPLPVITSLSGLCVTAAEREAFRRHPPLGVILFKRNVGDPGQLKALTDHLRIILPPKALIMMDQEGGRVRRLRPPHWPDFPAPGAVADFYQHDPAAAREALYWHSRLSGDLLRISGMNANCAPVLDLRIDGADPQVMGDRTLSPDPATVAALGGAMVAGYRDAGVMPVMKHLPGHGRATSDSHHELPRVDASAELLGATDFRPFAILAARFGPSLSGMTAHIAYRTLPGRAAGDRSAEGQATVNRAIVQQVIRGGIGLHGFLFSDDIAMGALQGSLPERTRAALDAGCDAVLYCSGKVSEYIELCSVLASMSPASRRRLDAVLPVIKARPPLLSEQDWKALYRRWLTPVIAARLTQRASDPTAFAAAT